MNDLEKEKLARFADDPVLAGVLLSELLKSIPPFKWNRSMENAHIGEALRAHHTALEYLNKGFSEVIRTNRSPGAKGGDNSNPAV